MSEIALLPCRFCGRAPGVKFGPPSLARCITPGCEGTKLAAYTFAEWNEYTAASPASPAAGEGVEARERIARIIDPKLFEAWGRSKNDGKFAANGRPWHEVCYGEKMQRILAQADAILRALSPASGGDAPARDVETRYRDLADRFKLLQTVEAVSLHFSAEDFTDVEIALREVSQLRREIERLRFELASMPLAPARDVAMTEGALREALRAASKAIAPFANTCFNDNGDFTVTTSDLKHDDYIRAYFAEKKIDAALASSAPKPEGATSSDSVPGKQPALGAAAAPTPNGKMPDEVAPGLSEAKPEGVGANAGHDKISFRNGIRRAVTWLHNRAREMNDPHAKAILNAAAFNLGAEVSRAALSTLRATPTTGDEG